VYCVYNRNIHKPFMIKKYHKYPLKIFTILHFAPNKVNIQIKPIKFFPFQFFFLLSFPLHLFSHHTRKPHSHFFLLFYFLFFSPPPMYPRLSFFFSPTTHIHPPSPISFFFSHFLLTIHTPPPFLSFFFLSLI
jgi:hypothetical protein